jgi:sugar O-acyltransferase (sialic acid O-acetyltransferase NeuD family)
MADAFEVLIPLINPNEPEVQIVEIAVENGQEVATGDVLCRVETTKSSNEIVAESPGFVVALNATPGDKLRSGGRLCWLAKEASWRPPEDYEPLPKTSLDSAPEGIRITKPALALAESSGVSLEQLPGDLLVTEDMIHKLIMEQKGMAAEAAEAPLNESLLVIYGGGGHGKALIDMVRAIGGYQIKGIIDDGMRVGDSVMDVPVLGGAEQLPSLAQQGVRQAINAVGGIGDVNSRVQVFKRLIAAAFVFPNLFHPSACIETSAAFQGGAQVFPHAYVGSQARLGLGVIVNTAAVISHDCSLADYVNIAPGALLAGNVTVGEGVLVGMGVTINLNVNVGAGAMIGNSAVVKADVPEGQVIRAGAIWPNN